MTQTPNDNDRTGSTANRATPSTGAERVPPVTPPGDPLGTPVPASAAKPATSPETTPGNRPDGAPVPASGTPHAAKTHADPARTEAARETGRTTDTASGSRTGATASSSRTGTGTGTGTGATTDTGRDAATGKDRPLFSADEREKFDARIHQAVAGFVENPRQAVQEADAAFDEVVAGLTKALADRSRLLRADRDGERSDAETEDLRIALQQYRDLTERLVRL
ncbi:hypothetical protein R2B67_34915 [Streptomyces cyaneofuscatus]|uniref:hypothetical protein n=1 Tax=Streptomyces cyaneofuscatus TaxID=66883 RepID=UPI002954675A|nr:hypothetical protein [Streptomyces cyaneofuscatus]WOP13423.1 hypothetical protein R2B67_34915 [Streptomyces cyaneofuscatus]